MADFKTHLSFGAATGFVLAIVTHMVNWVETMAMAVIIFFATVIGSFLPDMDSDSGLPIRIIFGLYAYFAATLTMYYLYDNRASIYLIIFLPIASFVFVNFYLKKIFSKYTTHRGIFHSIPAFLIAFFLSLFIAWTTDLPTLEKFSIALSISFGYLSHLVLDEIYSINILMSNKKTRKIKLKGFSLKKYIKANFGVKRSFGTALELGFKQKKKYPAIIAYIILIVLIIIAIPVMRDIFCEIFHGFCAKHGLIDIKYQIGNRRF